MGQQPFFPTNRCRWYVAGGGGAWVLGCDNCRKFFSMPVTKSGQLWPKSIRNALLFLERHRHACPLPPPEMAREVFSDDPFKVGGVDEAWAEVLADRLAKAAGVKDGE